MSFVVCIFAISYLGVICCFYPCYLLHRCHLLFVSLLFVTLLSVVVCILAICYIAVSCCLCPCYLLLRCHFLFVSLLFVTLLSVVVCVLAICYIAVSCCLCPCYLLHCCQLLFVSLASPRFLSQCFSFLNMFAVQFSPLPAFCVVVKCNLIGVRFTHHLMTHDLDNAFHHANDTHCLLFFDFHNFISFACQVKQICFYSQLHSQLTLQRLIL